MATILIVDDHVLNRQFLLALPGFEHHQLLLAVDGAEGLLRARAGRPDLILTDILMPRMEGCELVTRRRAEPGLCAIPVMYRTSTCSARQPPQRVRAGRNRGAHPGSGQAPSR